MRMNRHHQRSGRLIAPQLGLGLLCRRPQPDSRPSSGFTLIESLVAIIIIAITIVSVTPPIFWATGTRVQNRRAEQATQLAQSEIDRIRTGIERGDFSVNDLPPQAPQVGTSIYSPDNAAAPNGIVDTARRRSVIPRCNPETTDPPPPTASAANVIPVDTDPDTTCKPEFYIQVFRGTGITLGTDLTAMPDGLIVGVRVYSSSIVTNPKAAVPTLRTGLSNLPGKLKATNGLGTQQSRPLAVQYSVIVRSNTSAGLDLYRKLCEEPGTLACANPR
jgi:prepilin-type N-terminal cleavage/methylation domain-containing protein